jgi:hypothetical protein
MNNFLLLSGIVAIALGLCHSILGERLIFNRIKRTEHLDRQETDLLSKRLWAALRTTWHLTSLLGFGFAAMLFWMSISETSRGQQHWPSLIITVTFLLSAVFWLIGTRGKHPGWIPMVLIALLVWWS